MLKQGQDKKKKYYKVGETVRIKSTNQLGLIKSMNKETYEASVQITTSNTTIVNTFKFWEIDKVESVRTKRPRDKVYFAKMHPDARIPSKRHEDGCYDVYACFDQESIVIQPNETKMVSTGIASAFSPKYRFNAKRERGSTGTIGMESLSGQIDSGYRGEWFIVLHNNNDIPISITKETESKVVTEDFILYPYNKAICQAALEIVPVVDVEQVSYEELLEFKSERGTGKIGSSGK